MDLIDLMKDEKGLVTLEGGTTKIPTAQFEDLIRQSQTLQTIEKLYKGLPSYEFEKALHVFFFRETEVKPTNAVDKGDNDA